MTEALFDANRLVGLLAEPDRRRVVAALILSSGDLDDVMAVSGLDRRAAVTALDRLTAAGLVEVGADGVHVLLEEAFKSAARHGGSAGQPAPPDLPDGAADDVARVLAEYLVDGRLTHLPRKRAKRLVVLDHLAQLFEPGQRYSERQVNAALLPFGDDVATLRRYLVDEYFLDRADGEYWRSGGSVDTDTDRP